MAASSAAICNHALSHLGDTTIITTLASDTTTAGKACARFYETARLETLLAHPWQVAQVRTALSLIELVDDTNPEWTYKYRAPEDCLMPQRILYAGIRQPGSGERIPFRALRDTESTTYSAAVTYTTGQYAESVSIWYRALRETIADTPASSPNDWVVVSTPTGVPPLWLLCDVPDAVLEYTVNLTDPRPYPADLDNAIAARLAFYVAPKLVPRDTGLQAGMAQLFDFLIRQARANDANAEQRDPEPESSFERARW